MSKKIAVIGAGISGLTCAYELQKAGYDVTVYEKEKAVGGRMATRTIGTFPFDIGADHLSNIYDVMKVYCEEFKLEWLPMDFLGYQMFRDGKLYPIGQGISWISKMRLALAYFLVPKSENFLNMTDLVQFDTDNAYDYMKKLIGKEATDYLVDSFVSTYQFHRADETSKAAVVGIMNSIKKDNVRWNLHRLPGGMSDLPEAFAKRLNVKLETAVTKVQKNSTQVAVTVGNIDKMYDAVVVATTAPIAKALIPFQSESTKKMLDGARFATTISVSFKIPKGIMPKNAIYWIPYVESKMISGYVNEMMKGDDPAYGKYQTVNCWLHEEYAKTIMKKSPAKIFEALKDEFIRVSPWFDKKKHKIELYDVHKWHEAMPVFSHGHLTRVKSFLETSQGENNIYLTGDYLNAPWTEGALRCGQRVAKKIIRKLPV